MIWFPRIFMLRLRQVLSQPALWVMLLITLLLSLIPITRWQAPDERIPIGVVDLDGGQYAEEFINYLTQEEIFRLEFAPQEKALKHLAAGSLEGVVVLEEDFSEKLAAQEIADILTIYVAPSSSIAQLLSEVFSEKVFEIWAVEVVVQDMLDFQQEMGNTLPANYEQQLRVDMAAAARAEPLAVVAVHYGTREQLVGLETQTITPEEDASLRVYAQGMLWYAAFIVIFILVSSKWVIDQRKTALGERMRACGISPAVASLASALAVASVCLLGLLVCVGLSVIILPLTLAQGLVLALQGTLYLLAIIGLALAFSSLLRESLNLLLVAPVAALLNAVLGGMLAELPQWAEKLSFLTGILPGKLLTAAIPRQSWLPLVLAAALYLGLGVLLAALTTGVEHSLE